MSKKIKSPSVANKEKTLRHRTFTTKMAKEFSNTFMVNRLIGKPLMENAGGPDPFAFAITIEIVAGINVKSINVNGVIAKDSDFKVKDGKIVCEVKAFVSTFTFLLMINAEGDPLLKTTFNMTCDDKKVFDQDQDIIITDSGRGGYANSKVPLP